MKNVNREVLTKYTEARRANIRKSLEHRLEVARTQGNPDLIRALEAESKQFS